MSSISHSVSCEDQSTSSLVDNILEQGQKLRNSIVKSILVHDPFNTDIVRNSASSTNLIPSRLRRKIPTKTSISECDLLRVDKDKLHAFLQGEIMTKRDEIEALETLKSMSADDLCRTTNQALNSARSVCTCQTCVRYIEENLDCDVKRQKEALRNKFETERVKTYDIQKYMRFVDSLKVTVHDLLLNCKGNKMITNSLQNEKKVPVLGTQTFFIEYELPFVISVPTSRKKMIQNASSLKSNNFIRLCARRVSAEAINFKQTSMHSIRNIDQISLNTLELKFSISCRTMGQKNVVSLGTATFNFAKFETYPHLSCVEELPVVSCSGNAPIVLGKLRIAIQMGCEGIYFGKEFIASLSPDETENEPRIDHNLNETFCKTPQTEKKFKGSNDKEIVDTNLKVVKRSITEKEIEKTKLQTVREYEKKILFGFLYIPQAEYSKTNINSFITCRPFCLEDKCCSKLIVNESNPVFNFSQLVPLVYTDELLQQLRENVMVIEFWEKIETKELLFGVTKLSLHQFYTSYRNPDVTRYLSNNKFPIISSDWWETISNPYTDEIVGHVQVLLAVGTEQQIHNLEKERGFKEQFVKANFQVPIKRKPVATPISAIRSKVVFKKTVPVSKSKQESVLKSTEDKSVQSELDKAKSKIVQNKSDDKLNQILHFIKMQNQRSTVVETGTNTDNEQVELNANKSMESIGTQVVESGKSSGNNSSLFSLSKQYEKAPPLIKSTSDLLNTLQAALSIPPCVPKQPTANNVVKKDEESKLRTSFKAQISINQALHLPVRKKCKSKKSKGKNGKADENIKPSCYVTFETMPGLDLKITNLVPRSTNPNWNYKCDVFLPSELLLNNQKRLIIKVWRKSTNTTMVPNLQSDLILGFAAIDLTVLVSGFPNIQGWFNIMDFSSKCNGQINIHVTPLEDLSYFKDQKEILTCSGSPVSLPLNDEENKIKDQIVENNDHSSDQNNILNEKEDENDDDEPSELLSNALKRKFTELDEITQRLRLRLSRVTNEESDDGNDEIADEFERDINSLSIEEDFDMINFEDGNRAAVSTADLLKTYQSSLSVSVSNDGDSSIQTQHEDVTKDFEETEESLNILDRQLLEGKQRIDTLLGKLSLISGETSSASSRYISGCSASNRSNIDTEQILKDLDRNSRPNIHASTSFDNRVFNQIFEKETSSSGTSVISNSLGEFRAAPDGQNNLADDKNKTKK